MGENINTAVLDRYEQIPTVVKLREIIRKLWKLEIGYIDSTGFVVDHARGRIVPPHNEFCKKCLLSDKGLSSCDASVRQMNEVLASGAYPNGCIFDGICHLGLKMFAVPYYLEGEYIGAVFSCGFLTDQPSEADLKKLMQKISVFEKPPENATVAASDISVLKEGSLDYLLEMIRFGISEMEQYKKEVAGQEGTIEFQESQLKEQCGLGAIVGGTQAVQKLYSLIERAASSNSTVIIVLPRDEKIACRDILSGGMSDAESRWSELEEPGDLPGAMESLEKRMILSGLKKNNWNKSKVAKELGISRASLIMKVAKYGFKKDSLAI